MRISKNIRTLALCLLISFAIGFMHADSTNAQSRAPKNFQAQNNKPSTTKNPSKTTYTDREIIDAGHRFFGKTSGGLAKMVEHIFKSKGRPNAYIIGEEGGGAFIAGIRYGEGTLYPKAGGRYKIYWQGPSLGFDFGANGSRTLTLVYNMRSVKDLYFRFVSLEGSAYLVGGFGVNFQHYQHVTLAPIRTGVGLRLGVNMGYVKYTPRATWNPF